MQKSIRKILKMNEKQSLLISLLIGYGSALLAMVIVMIYAISIKFYDLLLMSPDVLAVIAIIASDINIVIAFNLGKVLRKIGFREEYIPPRKAVFILCSGGTALFVITSLLFQQIA